MNVTEQLTEIFRDLFDDEDIVLSRGMTADDIEDWDSLTHIQLMSLCEKEFQIKFSTVEMMHLKNVGDLIDMIEKKIK